jgi:hypothetical protein
VLVEGTGLLVESVLVRGEGVRGGLDPEVRRWKRLPVAVKVGTSLERRRPRDAAEAEVDEAAEVGMGMCSPAGGGSRWAIVREGRGRGDWMDRVAGRRASER